MKLAAPQHVRQALEGRLPADVQAVWYTDGQTAVEAVRDAEIAWLDIFTPPGVGAVIEAAPKLRWVTTLLAGLNGWPLDRLAERGLPLTNGVGINAIPVAEFAVMGVMAMAKGLPQLIRWQDQKTWTPHPAGTTELTGSKALVIGYGAIGREIGTRLEGLGVEVAGVRRSPSGEPGVLGPDDWRARLGEFDWVILAAPAVADTHHLIGAAELAAMKPSAVLVNIARGDLIDQPALIAGRDGRPDRRRLSGRDHARTPASGQPAVDHAGDRSDRPRLGPLPDPGRGTRHGPVPGQPGAVPRGKAPAQSRRLHTRLLRSDG